MSKYKDLFKSGFKLKISTIGVVLEGFLTGMNFLVLLNILNLIFDRSIDFDDILHSVYILALIFVGRLILYAVSYTGSQIGGADVSRKVRVGIGDKLRRIPLGLFTKNRTGFYINSATSEVADFEQILTHKMADIIKFSVLIFVMGLYTSFIYLPVGITVFLILLMLIPALAFSIRQVNIFGVKKNQAREENVSAITEYLTGSQSLRSYGLVGKKNTALTESMRRYSDISFHYEGAILPIGFVYVFLSYVGVAVSIIMLSKGLGSGAVNKAEVIILVMILLYVTKVGMSLYISLVAYRNLLISKDKIGKIFSEEEDIESTGKPEDTFKPDNYEIEFKNVGFEYIQNEPVLKSVSFVIPENKLTAIVGDSGSGKSTIFNLICKYYKASSGNVLIGGTDIAKYSTEEIFKYISLVDQEVFLFNDTVMSNIKYARPDATTEEIIEACKLANAHDFIMKMEQGYYTTLGENGNNLSGGERQRLSIARAIIRQSPIVLLDEATSSLDIENELLVKRAISNLLKVKRTVVMIAHTMPIVEKADKILVLSGGKIVEAGDHNELLKLGGKYTRMVQSDEYEFRNGGKISG